MKTPRLSPCGRPGRLRLAACIASAFLAATSASFATDYYVSPTGNDANNGTSPTTPWRTIETANAVVQPGDTVYLRGGEYESPTSPPDNSIIPAQSGTSSAPITYRAYPGETPVFTNIDANKYAFDLDGKSWIIIDGITVDGKQLNLNANVSQWGRIVNGAHDNIVRNSTFRYGKGSVGILLDDGAYRNQLLDNVFDLFGDWNDTTIKNGKPIGDKGETVNLRDTTHNLIEGNLFKHPGHNSLQLSYSAQYNVVRHNVFDGDWSDEYPLRSTGTVGNRSVEIGNENPPGTTLRNVFEHNVVEHTGSAVDALHPTAVKIQGQGMIARFNIIRANVGDGIRTDVLEDMKVSTHNHIYHNTLYDNGGPGWMGRRANSGSDTDRLLDHNVFVNNIVYRSRQQSGAEQADISLKPYPENSSDPLRSNKIRRNSIVKNTAGDALITVSTSGTQSISYWQANAPFNGDIQDNLEIVPVFTVSNPDEADEFKLDSSSALIDAGDFLTRAVGAGSASTTLVVQDAGFFSDGFGIVEGDLIRIGGGNSVEITAINYDTHTLTLASDRTWNDNAGVSLAYHGSAPDIGAWEYVPANNPPSVALTAPAANSTFVFGETVALTATASDTDGIAQVDFFHGATLIDDDATAPYTANWTPAGAGNYSLTAVAYDLGTPMADATSAAVPVTVVANSIPVITTTSLPGGSTGAAYSETLGSTGGNGALTWSHVSGSGLLPAGLSLSSAGVLSGTPTAAGTSNFTVKVADTDGITGAGDEDTQALSITVSGGGGGTPILLEAEDLTVTSNSDSMQTVGDTNASAGEYHLHNSNLVDDQITYSITVSTAGDYQIATGIAAQGNRGIFQLKIDGVNQGAEQDYYVAGSTAVFQERSLGTLTLSAGTHAFRFECTGKNENAGNRKHALDYIKLTPESTNSVPEITTTSLPAGSTASAYSQTLAATGGDGALSWSLEPGHNLPAGLTLSSAGVISGTPTAAGTGNFTVRVADADGVTGSSDEDTQALSITVTAPATTTFSPTHDAYLQGSTRYDTTELRVEAGNRVSYLQFNVAGLSGTVTDVKLRLTCAGDAGSGTIRVGLGDDNDWEEDDLTPTNAPTSTGELGNRNGTFALGTTYEWTLTGALTGNGTVSFIVTMDSGGNDAWFNSDEASVAANLKPQLVITTN